MSYLDCDSSLKQYANRILGLFDEDKHWLGKYTTQEIIDSAIQCLKMNNISSIDDLKEYCGSRRTMDTCDCGGIQEFIEKYKLQIS